MTDSCILNVSTRELGNATLFGSFDFTKGVRVVKLPLASEAKANMLARYPRRDAEIALYDLATDPGQMRSSRVRDQEQAIAANLVISTLGLLMTVVMAFVIVDRFGRRQPLIYGALGTAVSMAILDAVLRSTGATGSSGYIALAGLALFQISFAFSWGGVVWIVLGEMFPLHARGAAIGSAVFMTEITSVVVGVVFPILIVRDIEIELAL